ncbi:MULTISPECIES: LuxR C-terminal-related transcriptional regulator [Paracoccus]|jgi:PAS domain S-box-containing protein|uniref:Putative PAS/PAC sensor protein n=1 Tax=Paracoccus denitrificans (strain Pd 1222) TaxID=318586 RepID=A1BB49_PARDP|nr:MULTISPECIES: LuxR C-terminal-related transcriptional regulator [Paracoccus]ABL72743.1 putative PAS/PAC sensor protein [Paracoccus denitrificans PD1222]MBB4626221.1 PAS domain S-box-containing protein [Paracoccus denitrificans]MCU7427571.1 LuxR C-terminal-related transcriptional regulator [Paracoccus denitrificans]MDK8871072.1 LuxR C-terminal-related transcriptional regulator [Paracoccus sp. SSJ]QAR29707.1 helix-turn-helix transcriptional regulator [Paracoccus denitrificans]
MQRPAWQPQSRDYDSLGFQNAPDATLVLVDRVIVRASLMVEAVFGWTPQELEGQSMRCLYPGQTDFDLVGERARKALRERPFYRDERFMRRKDGRILWMEGRGRTMDQDDPHRLAIWTYRPLEAAVGAGSLLTATEKRIAGYLVNGFTSKEIAKSLGCSPRTVEVHRANMIRKTGVRNSFELVRRLLDIGAG